MKNTYLLLVQPVNSDLLLVNTLNTDLLLVQNMNSDLLLVHNINTELLLVPRSGSDSGSGPALTGEVALVACTVDAWPAPHLAIYRDKVTSQLPCAIVRTTFIHCSCPYNI